MWTSRATKPVGHPNRRRRPSFRPELAICEPRFLLSATPTLTKAVGHQVVTIAPSAFEATVVHGKNAGLTLDGILYFKPGKTAKLSGRLVRDDATTVPFNGTLHGKSLDLKFDLGHGKVVRGTGTVTAKSNGLKDMVLVGGGKLLGPSRSDRGNWAENETSDWGFRISNDSSSRVDFTTAISFYNSIRGTTTLPTVSQSLAAGTFVDVYLPASQDTGTKTSVDTSPEQVTLVINYTAASTIFTKATPSFGTVVASIPGVTYSASTTVYQPTKGYASTGPAVVSIVNPLVPAKTLPPKTSISPIYNSTPTPTTTTTTTSKPIYGQLPNNFPTETTTTITTIITGGAILSTTTTTTIAGGTGSQGKTSIFPYVYSTAKRTDTIYGTYHFTTQPGAAAVYPTSQGGTRPVSSFLTLTSV